MHKGLAYLKKKIIIIGIVFLFCASLIYIRWANIPMADHLYPPRTGTYGDVWSCLNVQGAAMYFRDHGFVKSVGLPIFGYTGIGSEAATYAYTHYPPLPDELAGIMATITGSTDTKILSLLPLILSLFFFGLIFIALQNLCPSRHAAMLGSIFTVISCYFICWADDIHQHVYGETCKWIFVLLLYQYYQGKEKRGILLGLLSLLALINTWITFEHIFYYGIVVAGFSLIFEQRIFTRTNIILMAMPIAGLGLHLMQNYYYFGSWALVLKDIKGAYIERTVGFEGTVQIGAKEIGELPSKLEIRFNRMFFIGTWPFLGLMVLGFIKMWKTERKFFWMGIVLFLASISWIFFMTQHVYIHLFTIRHFGLFYGLMVSWGIYALYDYYQQFQMEKKWWGIALCLIASIICFIPAIDSHFYYVYLKFGYLFPKLGLDHNLW